MSEVWRDIKEFNGDYQVSSKGRIKSLKHMGKGVIKSTNIFGRGYLCATFYMKNKPKLRKIHRLVAEAFIPNPENKPCINHKDGNKLNNHVSNLEWCTHKENNNHATEMRLNIIHGENHGQARLTMKQAIRVQELGEKSPMTHEEIGNAYGIAKSTAGQIIRKQRWLHLWK